MVVFVILLIIPFDESFFFLGGGYSPGLAVGVCLGLDCFLLSTDCEEQFPDMIQTRLTRPLSGHFPIS